VSVHRSSCPRCVADIAIFDPSYEDDGVWEEDVIAIEALVEASGLTWKRVDANDVRSGKLGSGNRRRFRALVGPGGWAWARNVALGTTGAQKIRSFLEAGGGYVGFCAGAYAAVATVSFDLYGFGWYDRYDYQLDLLGGTGQGPFGWMPWRGGRNIDLDEAAIDTTNPTMAAIGVPARTRFLYGGGPWFLPAGTPPARYEVWARAVAPAGALRRDGDGQPTIVRFAYGKGTVVLLAYHPEVLIGSMADRVYLSRIYDEGAVDWQTGDLSLAAIDLQSWNVAHAALQVASGVPVTALTALPSP
jgi:glutamine amidotransferase-like uncharacterized protein